MLPKHVEYRNKHTQKIVRRFGYLQGSYQDARSTKHNVSGATFNCFTTRAEKNYAILYKRK